MQLMKSNLKYSLYYIEMNVFYSSSANKNSSFFESLDTAADGGCKEERTRKLI